MALHDEDADFDNFDDDDDEYEQRRKWTEHQINQSLNTSKKNRSCVNEFWLIYLFKKL